MIVNPIRMAWSYIQTERQRNADHRARIALMEEVREYGLARRAANAHIAAGREATQDVTSDSVGAMLAELLAKNCDASDMLIVGDATAWKQMGDTIDHIAAQATANGLDVTYAAFDSAVYPYTAGDNFMEGGHVDLTCIVDHVNDDKNPFNGIVIVATDGWLSPDRDLGPNSHRWGFVVGAEMNPEFVPLYAGGLCRI